MYGSVVAVKALSEQHEKQLAFVDALLECMVAHRVKQLSFDNFSAVLDDSALAPEVPAEPVVVRGKDVETINGLPMDEKVLLNED